MAINLFPSQHDFVFDTTHRETCHVAGYGAGKTLSAACKALYLTTQNIGSQGAILSPTHNMLVGTFLPEFEDVLIEQGFTYSYKASPSPCFTIHFPDDKVSKVHCRSAENYRRLAGLNLAWAVVDEADLIDKEIALSMWKMLQSRLRTGNIRHLAMSTTPEGYNAAYELFVKQDKPFRKIYKSKTTDNKYLPEDYIENLYSSYSPQEIEAYINGEFINLKSGTVYYGYNRDDNSTDKRAEDFIIKNKMRELRPILHIGMDFNVNQTSGIVCIVKKEGNHQIVYVVDEFTELRDTDQLIEAIKERYPDYPIRAYPDSSGKNSSTATTVTDIALLKSAFGASNVKFPKANPRIMNRVKSVNARILNGKGERRLFINPTYCPTLVSCLEQQTYSKSGLPEKSNNLDHPIDAFGYAIHYMFPIVSRPVARNIR